MPTLNSGTTPISLHFAGHIISTAEQARFKASDESLIAEKINLWFEQNSIQFACGSAAAGADLLFAEACSNHDVRYQLTLPFPESLFIDTSIKPSGQNWVARFEKCLANAEKVTRVFDGKLADNNIGYSMCTLVALGKVIIDSHLKRTNKCQLTVWDEHIARPDAGTYADQMKAIALGFDAFYIQSHRGNLTHQEQAFPEIKETLLTSIKNLPVDIQPGKTVDILQTPSRLQTQHHLDKLTLKVGERYSKRLLALLVILDEHWLTIIDRQQWTNNVNYVDCHYAN